MHAGHDTFIPTVRVGGKKLFLINWSPGDEGCSVTWAYALFCYRKPVAFGLESYDLRTSQTQLIICVLGPPSSPGNRLLYQESPALSQHGKPTLSPVLSLRSLQDDPEVRREDTAAGTVGRSRPAGLWNTAGVHRLPTAHVLLKADIHSLSAP